MKVLLIVLLTVAAAFAQNEKRVIWSEPNCLMSRQLKDQKAVCDALIQNNESIRTIKYDGLFVAVTLFDDGEHFGADVFVKNERDVRTLVRREDAVIFVWKTDSSDVPPEVFPAIMPEKIAKNLRNRIAWANAFSALGGSLATTTTTAQTTQSGNVSVTDNRGNTANGTYSGTSQTTTVQPNTVAQNEVQRNNRQRQANADIQSDNILQTAFKSNTLEPNQSTNGLFYFKRNKKAKFSIFTLKIGDLYFDIPVNGKK